MTPAYQDSQVSIYQGDALNILASLPEESVQTCITSPPYWGLRDYGTAEQLGLEATPEEYVARLADIFDQVKRCLKKNGTLWLNLGDSYVGNMSRVSSGRGGFGKEREGVFERKAYGLKPKNLIGLPWRVAFELQQRGWILRSDIIWAKPNPLPESVEDRPTKSHEYIFLLSKSEKYYFDNEAIKEPTVRPGEFQTLGGAKGKDYEPKPEDPNFRNGSHQYGRTIETPEKRNKRSVWNVAVKPYSEAHFATYPRELIDPCILAGSKPGDMVLDPFMGSGTTALAAKELSRKALGCELNSEYIKLSAKRLRQEVLI